MGADTAGDLQWKIPGMSCSRSAFLVDPLCSGPKKMAVYHMIPAMTLRVASSARLGVQALSRAGGAEPVAVVGPLCRRETGGKMMMNHWVLIGATMFSDTPTLW